MKSQLPTYPIGPLSIPKTYVQEDIDNAITTLVKFPQQLQQLVENLDSSILQQPYREGSWTICQLIHHIADSHNHSYNRLRWTLTEDTPTIKAYNQEAYAAMQDYSLAPIQWSLQHIDIIHKKMVFILQSLTKAQWQRTFKHPETGAILNISKLLFMYAWHSKHHYAQIEQAIAKD